MISFFTRKLGRLTFLIQRVMFNKTLLLILISCSTLTVAAQQTQQQLTDTTKAVELSESVIISIRAKDELPITKFDLNRLQIQKAYYGADMPSLLQMAPSIHAYSDNGTGIGYSFFRLRGIDQTRINVTINGIPINDPQNQGVFFNNFADLASSASAIQIQRGVGTSTNGTASFGGSINVSTQSISTKPGAEIHAGLGSFGSSRLTAEIQTGKIKDRWGAYIRLSNLATDGYRERSGSEIFSYLFSAARTTDKSTLRFNLWGGDAQSTLAYQGIDAATMRTNRKANPFTMNERDRFRQHFFQVQHLYNINNRSGIQSSVYFVRGGAPQFQFYFPAIWGTPYSSFNMPNAIIGNDTFTTTNAMVSYKLNQFFYGAFTNYFYRTRNFDLDAGLHVNSFKSEHSMETQRMDVLPVNQQLPHRAYFNTGYKKEASAFVKINATISKHVQVFADVQVRAAFFTYEAKAMAISNTAFPVEDMNWLFLNPKLGINYRLNSYSSLYAMAGRTGREPTRFDYFQEDFARNAISQNAIKPEYVIDFEFGYRYKKGGLNAQINAYHMAFTNAILNTGKNNNFGAAITTNVNNSTRTGIELDVQWPIRKWVTLIHTSNVSRNNIKHITQYYNTPNFENVGFNFHNVQPALSPAVILNQGVRFNPIAWLAVQAQVRHVSKQYIDNSNSKQAEIPSFTVVDASIELMLKKWLKRDISLVSRINNVLNATYTMWGNAAFGSNTATPNGAGDLMPAVTPLFFVAPPRNYFITLQWKL